jgi:hypothetical protein
MIYNVHLPQSDLNIAGLSRIFKDTTNSYKYIFFLSILDTLKRRNFDASDKIYFRELIIEMLANSWFPYTYFKLSFGFQDQIINKLKLLNLEITDAVLKFTDTDKKQLRKTIGEQKIDSSLMRYVPYRLIIPFLEVAEKPKNDADINQWVKEKAMIAYDFAETPYLIERDNIKINQLWADYFQEYYTIIHGWVAWEWLNYMQRCNPNVLNLSEKLFPPQARASLGDQKKYWKVVIENAPVYCIFSKERITSTSPPLDHFLPWSFVAHDQLWNLIPILQSVNSSKSNNLPNSAYHQDFILLQHLSLVTSHQHLIESAWNKYTEPYLLDLKIVNRDDLLNLEILATAYKPILDSLTGLAKGQGFSSGWTFQAPANNNSA